MYKSLSQVEESTTHKAGGGEAESQDILELKKVQDGSGSRGMGDKTWKADGNLMNYEGS